MSDAAARLAGALRQRRAIIADEVSRRSPEQHMARLKEVSERIEALQHELRQPVDSRLLHFLKRASYDKALEYLEGRAPSP